MGTPCIPDDITGNFFGPLNQFEGIGWDGTRDNSHTKHYSIRCNICKNDPELFGDGIYKTTRSKLMKGIGIPCGCSKNPRWTNQQWKLKVQRACDKTGNIIVNFLGDKIQARSRVLLRCPVDQTEWSPEVRFIVDGQSCPTCQRLNHRKLDEDMVTSFLDSGKFLEGTRFWRDEEKTDINGNKIFWNYTCPRCSDDKFVKAGLCSGVFSSSYSTLQSGNRSCRCVAPRWTKDQREFTIKEIIEEENLPYKFLGWKTGGIAWNEKFILDCKDHGLFYPGVSNFINNSRRCPGCSKHGFDPTLPSTFYILETEKFTGYGITRDVKTRMGAHRNSLSKYGLSIVSSSFYAMSGKEALNLETAVRRNFELTPQPVVGFMKEATHLFSLADVNSFAQKWQASLLNVELRENRTLDDILEDCSPI